VCQSHHYVLRADLVGARNITLRTLLVRQDWMSTGVLSIRPDVSDDETKAARRVRYAELRWSPDTSPCLPSMGSLTLSYQNYFSTPSLHLPYDKPVEKVTNIVLRSGVFLKVIREVPRIHLYTTIITDRHNLRDNLVQEVAIMGDSQNGALEIL
jgi:hypothetical protein